MNILRLYYVSAVILSLGGATGCYHIQQASTPGSAVISVDDYRTHLEILSSDKFEGRLPATLGEELTIAYLADQFGAAGLLPANDESWFQEVPLVQIQPSFPAPLVVHAPDGEQELQLEGDYVAASGDIVEEVSLDKSELVFAGYGIVAPEYDWNDYAGLDVTGKAVLVLVNDPGYATQDPALFNGNAMTYYGRYPYKYEEGARQGAAAVFVIHDTGPAGYPWAVIGSYARATYSKLDLISDESNVEVEGWIKSRTVRQLMSDAGLEFDQLKQAASNSDFTGVPLNRSVSLTIRNDIARSMSHNVAAILPGSKRPEEVVVYMGHWDHLGMNSDLEGDKIFNGALDNASGTAGLLVLARTFAALDQRPSRTILFLAVTAEEQGLLGSKYYVSDPLYPLGKTVAAINLDGMNLLGPMHDITLIGKGSSELDGYVTEAAARQERTVRPDSSPEKGFFYRSDQFNFAKHGVPSIYISGGLDHVDHGVEWTREQKDIYTAQRYHAPSDEYDPEWDLRGTIDDLNLVFEVGQKLAKETHFPNWTEGNEFKAIRDSMMK
ncbi:M28 family metallopeptidase [Candidatus Neomarinimicrobiota bacterium]